MELYHLNARPVSSSSRPRYSKKELLTAITNITPWVIAEPSVKLFKGYRAIFQYVDAWYGKESARNLYRHLHKQFADLPNPFGRMDAAVPLPNQSPKWATDPRSLDWQAYLTLNDFEVDRLSFEINDPDEWVDDTRPEYINSDIYEDDREMWMQLGDCTSDGLTFWGRKAKFNEEALFPVLPFDYDPYQDEVTKLTGVRIPSHSHQSLGEWLDLELHLRDMGIATTYDRTLGLRDDNTHRVARRIEKKVERKEDISTDVHTVDWMTFLGENIYEMSAETIVKTLRVILSTSVDRFWQAGNWLADVYGEFNARTFMGIAESLEDPLGAPLPAATAA